MFEIGRIDGFKRTFTLKCNPDISVQIKPLSVTESGRSMFDPSAIIRFGVVSIHGIGAGGKEIGTGSELADILRDAWPSKALDEIMSEIVGAIRDLTDNGVDSKNSEPSPPSS